MQFQAAWCPLLYLVIPKLGAYNVASLLPLSGWHKCLAQRRGCHATTTPKACGWEMGSHSMGCSKCRWCCRFWAMDGHGMFTLPPIIMIIMEGKNASQRSISMDPGDGCSTVPVSMLVVLVDVSMLNIQGPQCTCQDIGIFTED